MIEFSPTPSEEEAAAILAAYELLWPQQDAAFTPREVPRWRLAGRRWCPRPGYGGWG